MVGATEMQHASEVQQVFYPCLTDYDVVAVPMIKISTTLVFHEFKLFCMLTCVFHELIPILPLRAFLKEQTGEARKWLHFVCATLVS